jgi:hypothetical protein
MLFYGLIGDIHYAGLLFRVQRSITDTLRRKVTLWMGELCRIAFTRLTRPCEIIGSIYISNPVFVILPLILLVTVTDGACAMIVTLFILEKLAIQLAGALRADAVGKLGL